MERMLEMAGLCVLANGGTLEEAYAADDDANAQMQTELAADAERSALMTRKLKLQVLDVQTRIEDRLERRQRRQRASAASRSKDAR